MTIIVFPGASLNVQVLQGHSSDTVNHLEILGVVGEEDSASNICRKKGIGGGDGYAVKPDG
jgi:hypothetical protein